MKYIYLVRHAKSYWNIDWLDDFERPLNKRGKRDGPVMAAVLQEKSLQPDTVLVSPAARSAATARMIVPQLNYPLEQLHYLEQLYDADSSEILRHINMVSNHTDRLMVIAHNPGITILANRLANSGIENVPTTGVVGIELNVPNWAAVNDNTGTMQFFEYPKKHKG